METRLKDKYELKVKSSTGNLVHIRDFIQSACKLYNVDHTIVQNIILAVDEACTNIIKHAYNNDEEQHFIISLSFKNHECIITLIDNGKSYNPEKIPQPDMPTYFKQRKVGGLGLHLMKRLMDFVEYHHEKGVNRLVMKKKIGS